MMDEKAENSMPSDISVVDVYDLASEIGKECEKIIDCYGPEAVTSLMPKVVQVCTDKKSLSLTFWGQPQNGKYSIY